MNVLAIIEILLLVNMALFVVVFSLLAPPPGIVQVVVTKFLEGHPGSAEQLQSVARGMLRFYGVLGCTAVFGWAILTGFVITLYRQGFFTRF